MSSILQSDCYFQSRTIKTDVTVVKIISSFIFAGIGNVLHAFNIGNKTCQYFSLLHGQRIHGIRFNSESSLVIAYGNREIVVASFRLSNGKVSLSVVSRWIVGDWIWDVKWLKNTDDLILLSANNTVSAWNWKTRISKKIVKCHDKCLLFCGIIVGTEWCNSIVMCGTMFKSILIWAPSSATRDTCNVLHKLLGHRGAIFSVIYHEKSRRICSTSDDRSARIWLVNFANVSGSVVEAWSKAIIIPMFTVFGHMSRVWKSFILDDARFITAGEDSQLRVWNRNGDPMHTWETHQGASIRSMDVCEALNVIVTGSKDGGISLWPLCTDSNRLEIAFCDDLNLKSVRDVPRRLLLTKSGSILTITNEGMLLMHSNAKWHFIHSDSRFASYCLFEISPSRSLIALASIAGDVKIFRESEDEFSVDIIYADHICNGRIFSIHWLSEDHFITCATDGKLEIWSLKFLAETYYVEKVRDYILPQCKERWLTSAIELQSGIVVGDREGSVHMFHDDGLPSQSFRRVHGRLGVSWISCGDNAAEFYSIGRDGFIRYWNTDGMTVGHLAADKLPIKWPVRVFSSVSQGLLVFGFNETNFELWNVKERKKLFTCKCGGGHRPWDFTVDTFAQFVYIREKSIFNVTFPLKQLVKSYLDGFHIRDVICIRYLNENLIVSGGEDTTLRLSKVNSETGSFEPLIIIRSHISSIRAISFLHVDDFILMISAGGRAQMKVWKLIISDGHVKHSELASHMLQPSNKCRKPWLDIIPTYDLEPRHMDVQIERLNEEDLIIYAAGSDAFWRVYKFNLTTKTLELLNEISYSNYCILKLLIVFWRDQKLIITLATDGRATFWHSITHSRVHQQVLHQSGINSCDYAIVDDHLILITGGDDATVVVTLFENVDERIGILAQWRNNSVHEAQISGIRIVKNYFISVGADQKVVLWKWVIESKDVVVYFKTFYHSFVPDIHGLDATASKENICVYGAGVELLSLKVPQFENIGDMWSCDT